MSFDYVGLVWTPDSLVQYLTKLKKPKWCTAITLHHTWRPSLEMRPKGFLMQHLLNMRHHYRDIQGWKEGPHLFIDEDQIFGMCALRRKGVHAARFNSYAIGIEVLGDYDSEDPFTGRGLACWMTTAAATRVLLDWLGLKSTRNTILFHRDDPETGKSCPGNKVKKEWFFKLLEAPPISPQPPVVTEKPSVGMAWEKWDFRGECWCVPVYEFLVAYGIPSETVIEKLKFENGYFFFGTEILEGAYCVNQDSLHTPNECAWAPVREILELI